MKPLILIIIMTALLGGCTTYGGRLYVLGSPFLKEAKEQDAIRANNAYMQEVQMKRARSDYIQRENSFCINSYPDKNEQGHCLERAKDRLISKDAQLQQMEQQSRQMDLQDKQMRLQAIISQRPNIIKIQQDEQPYVVPIPHTTHTSCYYLGNRLQCDTR